MVTVTSGKVFIRWGDGGIPLEDGQMPVFDHFDVFRDDGEGDSFIGQTSAFSFIDQNVTPGNYYVYKVVGVEVDVGGETAGTLMVMSASVMVPVSDATGYPRDLSYYLRDLSEQVIGGGVPPPVDYQLTPKQKKLRHAWRNTMTKGQGLLGTIIEDTDTGHAVAFVPAKDGCSAYWDQPTGDYGCYRLRNIDENLNVSSPTDWVCASPSTGIRQCEGGTIGDSVSLLNSVVYGAAAIGDEFCNAASPIGNSEVVGWGVTIGDNVTFGMAVTVGELAVIADDQSVSADTVIPYNGKVPDE